MTRRVAIVGAGFAGMAFARALSPAWKAKLFDKGGSPGGRVATRRVSLPAIGAGAGTTLHFNHGAQFVRGQDPVLRAWLLHQEARGLAGRDHGARSPGRTGESFTGLPGMSALSRAFGEGLDVATRARVTRLAREDGAWRLTIDGPGGQDEVEADAVVVAAPAPQAEELVRSVCPKAAGHAASARMSGCWSAMFAAAQASLPQLSPGRVADDPVIAWIAPARAVSQAETSPSGLIVQARRTWSTDHLEEEPDMVLGQMRERLFRIFGADFEILHETAHRWRYAFVVRPAPGPCYWDPAIQLGMCGDWLAGPRIESAVLSGRALSAKLNNM